MITTVLGEPVVDLGADAYAVTYPYRISQQTAEFIKREWAKRFPDKHLIIFDGGAKITPIWRPSAGEATPVYDELAREFGWSA